MSGTRSRSRSPVRDSSQELYDIDSLIDDVKDDESPTQDCRKFHIDNYPARWTYKEIKQFIKDRTNSSIISDAIKFVRCSKNWSKKPSTVSIIEFTDANACRQAFSQLKARQNEKCEGNTILIRWESKQTTITTNNSGKKNNSNLNSINSKKPTFKPTKPQVSLDTYGLSTGFLDHLGIKLPLLNKIFVAHLEPQVDEAKIREVFGYAGQIVDVFMIQKENKAKMAKIEFDHPLEAVQAISMFQNQELYGRMMAVQMDNSPMLHNKPLPNGLTSIGPGLGPDGVPMRAIRYMTEMQSLKELINTEITKLKLLINPLEQMNNLNNQSDNSMSLLNTAMNVQNAMTPLNINTMPSFSQPVVNPFINAQSTQNLQLLQGLLQQNAGNELTATLAALQAQSLAPNLVGFNQSYVGGQSDWNNQSQMNMNQTSIPSQQSTNSDNGNNNSSRFDKRSRESEDTERKTMTTDMLIFNNLPSSVTLSALKSKMREVGDLKFAEITDEGKAIVRFHSTQDAERCVKLFDRSKVDGQTINVRFF